MFSQLKERKLLEQRQRVQESQPQPHHNTQPTYRHPSPIMRHQPNINDSATIIVATSARTRIHHNDASISRISQCKRRKQQQNCSPMNGRVIIKQPLGYCNSDSNKPMLKTALANRNQEMRSKSPSTRPRNYELDSTVKPSRNQGYLCEESVVIISKKPSITSDELSDIQQLKQRQKKSSVFPLYLHQHPALNFKARAILLDWMMQLSAFYHLHRETYYIAVSIVDSYLSVISNMPLSYFQLLGVTSLFLASKLEEYEPQSVEQLSNATNNAFSEEDILKMEMLVMQALKFKIRNLTHSCWINQFVEKWMEFDHRLTADVLKNRSVLYRMMYQIIDVAQLDIESLQFKCREIVGGLLLLVICFLSEQISLEEIQYSLPLSSKYLLQSTNNTVLQYKRFLGSHFSMKTIQLLGSVQFISSYFFSYQGMESEEFSLPLQNFRRNHLKMVEMRQQFVSQTHEFY